MRALILTPSREGALLKSQVRKLVKIISLLIAIAWWPSFSHCMMEDAGWIASDQCCSEQAEDSHESEPAHDECTACFFESSAMLSIKSDAEVCAVQLELLDTDSQLFPDLSRTDASEDYILLEFSSGTCLHQLALPRICPIRGPSLLS